MRKAGAPGVRLSPVLFPFHSPGEQQGPSAPDSVRQQGRPHIWLVSQRDAALSERVWVANRERSRMVSVLAQDGQDVGVCICAIGRICSKRASHRLHSYS
jgi:hypothetical protein